ncbi:MAG: hypothetical protein ACK5YV_05045 [Betaproteobacteria bacterium]|jgi:hypothetical protein
MGWEFVAYLLVAAVVSYALAPKPPQQPPPSVEDVDAPTAEEGRPLGVIFGEVWITGPNVVWYGDLRTTPIRRKGGKK